MNTEASGHPDETVSPINCQNMSNQLKMTDISDSESSLEVAHQVAVDSTANIPPGAAKLYVHVEIPQDEFAASDVLSSQDSKLGESVGSDFHIVYSSGASENLNSTNSSLSTDSLAGKTDNKDISSVLEQSLKGGDTQNSCRVLTRNPDTTSKSGVSAAGAGDCDITQSSLPDDVLPAINEEENVTETSNSLMPSEQLDSDDSDTAGVYQLNNSSSTHQDSDNDDSGVPFYQRGVLESSSSPEDNSSSDASEGNLFLRVNRRPQIFTVSANRWLFTGRSSSPEVSDEEESDTENGEEVESTVEGESERVDATPPPIVTHNILSYTQSRSLGDFGYQRKALLYTKVLRSNPNFVKRMRCVGTLDSHSGCVNALNFNQSGTYLASGSDDLKVVVWDMIRLSPYISFQSGHVSNVFQSKFMPHSNDSQIVTCARDGQVRLAELSVTGSCRETRKICEHADSCHKLAVETDPEYCLLSAGEDAMVFQIDVRSKKPNRLVQVLQSQMKVALYSIDKHPHKPYEFIVSGRDHYIRVYDKRFINSQSNSSDVVKRLTPSKFDNKDRLLRDVTCAVYNCNGSEIVGTYNDEDIYLFDNELPAEEACINTYTGHRNSSTVKGVNFYGPNSEYIVSGSDCGNVFFWDKTSSEPLQIQKGDEGGVVNVLEPHPHLPYLAVSGLDNSVKVFMPVGEKLTSMSKFKKLMKRNTGRQGSRMASNALIDTVERTFLMSALRAIHWRRRRREAGDDADADDADDESDEAESSVQCPVS